MKHIKLIPDYDCHPLWHHQSKEVGNIDPETLGISSSLVRRLNSWQQEYNQTQNREDPIRSGFTEKETEAAFVAVGYKLANDLNQELPSVNIVYYDISKQSEYGIE